MSSANEPLTNNEDNAAAAATSSTTEVTESDIPQTRQSRVTNYISTNVPRHLIFILLLYNVGFIFHQMFFGK
jgi:hypothetical protein